jgi:hypothetical protein
VVGGDAVGFAAGRAVSDDGHFQTPVSDTWTVSS